MAYRAQKVQKVMVQPIVSYYGNVRVWKSVNLDLLTSYERPTPP